MTDKRVMPYLMEANGVVWPQPPHHPVEIESWGSIDAILKPEAINNEVKEPGREALGVVVDANGDAAARWDELKVRCDSEFAGLPDRIPDKGLHLAHSLGTRFGVWIMPDSNWLPRRYERPAPKRRARRGRRQSLTSGCTELHRCR